MATPSCRSPDHRAHAAPSRRASFPRVVVMVKEPVAGRVKTRLARGIGAVQACRFYRTATANLIARLAADPRWQLVLAVSPDIARAGRSWPAHIARMTQGRGDLGRRMQRVLDHAPRGPVLIIGSDIPDVLPRHIADALARLGKADTVIGPACDGGYWLIGARRMPRIPRPFAGVRWSSRHTRADTLANLGDRTVSEAATLDDVDEPGDLERHGGRHARRIRGVADDQGRK